MAKTRRSLSSRELPDSYFRLVRDFPLTRIQSEVQLDQATAICDQLLQRPSDAGIDAYLEVLGTLIAEYEETHHAIQAAGGARVLRHLLEANELSQAELAAETGLPRSVISEMLSGKREFSRNSILALAKRFQVPPAVFFDEAPGSTRLRRAE